MQLPVNEAHRVNSIQREDNFSTIELGPFLWHIIITHQVNEVTPGHVIHHHVQIFGILEGKVKLWTESGYQCLFTTKTVHQVEPAPHNTEISVFIYNTEYINMSLLHIIHTRSPSLMISLCCYLICTIHSQTMSLCYLNYPFTKDESSLAYLNYPFTVGIGHYFSFFPIKSRVRSFDLKKKKNESNT